MWSEDDARPDEVRDGRQEGREASADQRTCCGEGGAWCHAAGGVLVLACQLCPKSPTYWRRGRAA